MTKSKGVATRAIVNNMEMRDLFSTALESLARAKSRSILTMLGIVIGIAAVILTLAIGRSAEGLILNQVADLGSNLLFAEPSNGQGTSGPPSPFIQQSLTMKDAEALEKSPFLDNVAAALVSSGSVSHDEVSTFTDLVGVDEQYLAAFPADIAAGRWLDTTDVDAYAPVAVLGQNIAKDLFGDQDPIGQRLKIKRKSFRVVGVLAEQGSRFFQDLDKRIAVPVTTMQRDVLGVDYINFISMHAVGDLDRAKDEARFILRDTHRIDNPEGDVKKDDFMIASQSDAAASAGIIGGILSVLLSSIAAISLVVGGIGIMNIMLVSVTERTKEIGLRKAVGAGEQEILHQFLLEAVMLTLVGGIIGVTCGVLMSFLSAAVISQFVDGWVAVVPVEAIVLGVAVSTAVGLAFGYYPARRAARLDPIEALRYE